MVQDDPASTRKEKQTTTPNSGLEDTYAKPEQTMPRMLNLPNKGKPQHAETAQILPVPRWFGVSSANQTLSQHASVFRAAFSVCLCQTGPGRHLALRAPARNMPPLRWRTG